MDSARQLSVDSREFAGTRALVTGGTQGAGEAIARRLAAGGATVATTARSPMPDGQRPDMFVQADISTAEGVERVVRQGGFTAPGGGFAVLSDEEWHAALNLNLFAAVRLDRALLPGMIERGSGVIIQSPRYSAVCRFMRQRWPTRQPERH